MNNRYLKKVCLILFLIFATSLLAIGQCVREGDFYNSTDISTSGKVTVKQNKKGKLVIKIASSFKTQEGPDLDVYLSEKETITSENSYRVKPLFTIEGGQRYVTEEAINLDDYEFVVIHCTKYSHWYGSAKLGDSQHCE